MAAEDLLNLTGLTYFKGKCDATYATKAEAVHPIESIKFNGTTVSVNAQKEANIVVGLPEVIVEPSLAYDAVGSTFKVQEEVSAANATVAFKKTTEGVGISADHDPGMQRGFAEVNLASKAYVDGQITIKEIYQNGTQLTPLSGGRISFNTTELEGTSTYIKIEGSSGTGEIQFTEDTNGILTQGEIEAGGGTQVFNKVLVSKTYVDNTFQTSAQVQTAITTALAGITGVSFQVVSALPSTGENGVFYLVGNSGTGSNIYDEYIWVNKGTTQNPDYGFEMLGTTAMDLSNYVQKSDINIITTSQIDALFT